MNDWSRLVATTVVWGAAAFIIVATTFVTREVMPLGLVLAIGATISTAMIWESARPARQNEAIKSKRDSRVSRLVNRLDDEEVYELEELLASRHDALYKVQD